MSINSDVALKRWKPAKNHERQRCGDNLYVRGFLTGRKLFQMRFANDPWIDIGDYPDKSLAQAREITITAKTHLQSASRIFRTDKKSCTAFKYCDRL